MGLLIQSRERGGAVWRRFLDSGMRGFTKGSDGTRTTATVIERIRNVLGGTKTRDQIWKDERQYQATNGSACRFT